MSEALDRIGERLRQQALQNAPAPAAKREEALLEILRKELNRVPDQEIFGVLARLRGALAGPAEGEASRLWACLAQMGGAATTAAETPPEGPGRVLPAEAAGQILGSEARKDAPADPRIHERLLKALALLVDLIDQAEAEFQRALLLWRKSQDIHGGTGRTLHDLRGAPSLRKKLAQAVYDGAGDEEIQTRIKMLGASASLAVFAYDQAIRKSLDRIRGLIDPDALEQAHGREAWARYRQVYKNRLQGLGREFQEEFFATRFLEEFFARYRKL